MLEIDYTKEASPSTLGEKIFYYIFIGLMVAGFTAEVFINYEPIKLSVLFFLAAWMPLIFLHELGHAVVARMLGWEVVEFVIGYGKLMKKFTYRGTQVEFRMIPLGGYILPKAKKMNWSRAKSALVYFAGPGAELIVFFLCWSIIGYGNLTETTSNYATILMQGIAFSAATGAVINLIPHDAVTAEGNVPNDGLGIILALFGDEKQFQEDEDDRE